MKEEIEKLNSGERYIVPESGYGKAEVWRINNVYVVFEIPMFGGEPYYLGTFSLVEIEEVIYRINNLT